MNKKKQNNTRLLLLLFLGVSVCLGGCSPKERIALYKAGDAGGFETLQGISPEICEETDAAETLQESETAKGEAPAEGEVLAQEETLFVHVCGAVNRPGVYELPVGSRVFEVIDLAGGFRTDACMDYINLALTLEDGWKLMIPTVEEAEELGTQPDENPAAQSAEAEKTDSTGLVNINSATEEQLCTLPGIGASKAAAVIAYRQQHGAFATIDEIMQVDGIGAGTFAKFKDRITI